MIIYWYITQGSLCSCHKLKVDKVGGICLMSHWLLELPGGDFGRHMHTQIAETATIDFCTLSDILP